ncbi:hypothetical protein AKJ09_01142 [Labilithrix luteola]|uniref:Uncharacterized protein n=1 Tax=Labilithrix luteola TaxID=1391654 RepID=A0A0K1PLR6_9BACT|nr:hypothetical protein [Labilithrix luteola]AKU94478.1 hypothetical protein AKJ09_01142 [Labilithrix luteola]
MQSESLRHRLSMLAAMIGVASFGYSCNLDPVHKAGVDSLGEENSAAYPPETEYHRPGEPCTLCHSKNGPAKSVFALAGTIFWGPDDYNRRVDQAYVRILDAKTRSRCFVTNCNGNFFVRESDFPDITFPLLVSIERTKNPGTDESTFATRRMTSHIGRESSCANCHIQGLRDYASSGQIHMYDEESQVDQNKVPTPPSCPNDLPRVTLCPEDRL